MKANITLRSGINLPKLGLSNFPSPYTIMELNKQKSVSGICFNTCSPYWNFQTSLSSAEGLDQIKFYVFNSNPNDVDELLAYGSIQFQQLLTKVPTRTKILLSDGSGTPLRAYLQLQHYDDKTDNIPIAFSQQTCITITLLSMSAKHEKAQNWLKKMKNPYIELEYGQQVLQLSQLNAETSFPYKQSQHQIKLFLSDENQPYRMEGSFHLQNVGQASVVKCRVFYRYFEIYVMICVRIIQKGLLPPTHNIMTIQLSELKIEPETRKPKNWNLVVNSLFQMETIKAVKDDVKVFVENKSEVLLEFVESTEQYASNDLQPLNSYCLMVNGVNWSEKLEAKETVILYNQSRGFTISIVLRLGLIKTSSYPLAPTLHSPESEPDKLGRVRVQNIKMTGAHFSQIFTQKTLLKFIHLSPKGSLTVLNAFQLKNASEYFITSKVNLNSRGEGTLFLACFDHQFGQVKEESARTLENHYIFRIKMENITYIGENAIAYNEKFLSFAKKITLAKPCKRFQQMVKDRTLELSVSTKILLPFTPGLLTIHNSSLSGNKSKANYTIIFNTNQFSLSGQSGQWLQNKSERFIIQENNVGIKYESQGKRKTLYTTFEQLFGTPKQQKLYKLTVPITTEQKLTLIYSYKYKKSTQEQAMTQSKLHRDLELYSETVPLTFRLKNLYIQQENYDKMQLRATKGTSVYESLAYGCVGNVINFYDCEKVRFLDGKKGQNERYVFFNLYCKNSEGDLIIFSGHLDVRTLMGKGNYEIILNQMNEENKKSAHLIIQLLSNIPLVHAQIKLSLSTVSSSRPQYIKRLAKYYLVIEIHFSIVGIFQLKKESDILTLSESIEVKYGDNISWRMYTAMKSLSKEEFWKSDKELIGSGRLGWNQLENNGILRLRYLPTRDLKAKFNQNKLVLEQNTVKFNIPYSLDVIPSPPLQLPKRKQKTIDLDVLHSALLLLNITEIIPHYSSSKTIQFLLQPCGYKFCCHAKLGVYEQFLLELKQNEVKFTLVKSERRGEKYLKSVAQCMLNLKGKHLKTHDVYAFTLNFPGLCLLHAQATVVSNRFTNSPIGTFELQSFSTSINDLTEVQVSIMNAPSDSEASQTLQLDMRNKTEVKPMRQFSTQTMQTCVCFVLVLGNRMRVRTMVELAKLDIDKIDNDSFAHEWVVKAPHKLIMLQMKADYVPKKRQEMVKQEVEYDVGGNKISASFSNKDEILMVQSTLNKNSEQPPRQRGYKLWAQIPEHIDVQSIKLLLPNNQSIQLQREQTNKNKFRVLTYTQPNIQALQLVPPTHKIQQLEGSELVRRFLLDGDVKSIIKVVEEPYPISTAPKQQHCLTFRLHRLLSSEVQPGGKIMWLKSNKHDEILTRSFGVVIKHGEQQAVVRGIKDDGTVASISEEVILGYVGDIDEVTVTVFIDHALNQTDDDFHPSLDNWVKYLPVCVGTIDLSRLGSNVLVGCQLTPISNNNSTLDHYLNQVIVRPSLQCLCSLTLQCRHWAHISLTIDQMTPIILTRALSNSIVYLVIRVETTKKECIGEVITDGRPIGTEIIRFVNRKLTLMHIEMEEQMYSVRVSARVLAMNNNIQLFEKRIDVSKNFHEPGYHTIISHIKPSEAQGITEPIQLTFSLRNTPTPYTQSTKTPASQAKQINTVDMVSFGKHTCLSMGKHLLLCQHRSHLMGGLQEVKEAVLYGSQEEIFPLLCRYLAFTHDDAILQVLLHTIHLAILQYEQVMKQLRNEDNLCESMYKWMLVIARSQEVIPESSKPQSSQYRHMIQGLSQISQIKQEHIEGQKMMMYTGEQLLHPSSGMHRESVLTILDTVCSNVKYFEKAFINDVKLWNEVYFGEEADVLLPYFQLVEKMFRTRPDPHLYQTCVETVIRRGVGLRYGVEFWARVSADERKNLSSKLFSLLTQHLGQKQVPHHLRTFFNYLLTFNITCQPELWENCANSTLHQFLSINDANLSSTYGELLNKIDTMGHLAEQSKMEYIRQLHKREQASDRQKKLIYTNLLNKIQNRTHLKPSGRSSPNRKNNFYKKYLITS